MPNGQPPTDPHAATLQLGEVGIPQRVGKYLVERVLGHGGMATVYFAREEGSGREVALKVLAPNFVGDAKMLERFRSEAQVMSQLIHRHVVGVLGWGATGGQAWLATEYVDSGTVRQLKDSTGPMVPQLAGELVVQMLAGLVALHERDMVHRDLKPENLFMSRQGVLKVGDFGLARATDQTHLTGTGMLVGTAQYMSPEQVQSRELDARSDLFSAGIIFYELLAGVNPFEAGTPVASLGRVSACLPPPLSELAPGTPPAFEALVDRLLTRDREARVASARAALEELEALLAPERARRPTLLAETLASPVEVAHRLRAAQAEALVSEAKQLSKGNLQAQTLAAVRLHEASLLDPARADVEEALGALARANKFEFAPPQNPKISDLENALAEKPTPAVLLQLSQLYKLEGNPVVSARYLRRCLKLKPGDVYIAGLITQLTGEKPALGPAGPGSPGDLAGGIRTGGLKAMQREAPVGAEVATPARAPAPSAELEGITMTPLHVEDRPLLQVLRQVGWVVVAVGLLVLSIRAVIHFVERSSDDVARAERELRRGGLKPHEPGPGTPPMPPPLVKPPPTPAEPPKLASDPEARAKLDQALKARADDDVEGALAGLLKVIDAYPHALEKGEALLALEKLREDQALFPQAKAALDRFVRELDDHPRLPEALLRRGLLNDQLLMREAAEADYRRVVDDFPDAQVSARAHLRLGLLLKSVDKPAEARLHLRRAMDLSGPGDEVRNEAAAALENLK